jgi:hypothetical protein
LKKRGSKIASARDLFEIDRDALFGQLQALLLAVRNTSTEITMIAAESVFDRRLSAELRGKARLLNREARRLEAIGAAIARAKFPRIKNRAASRANSANL